MDTREREGERGGKKERKREKSIGQIAGLCCEDNLKRKKKRREDKKERREMEVFIASGTKW